MDAIIAWIMANIGTIGAVIAGIVAVDELLLKIFPSPSGTSVLARLLEILQQLLKIFPSQNPPPPKA